jgi:hypothetical protein
MVNTKRRWAIGLTYKLVHALPAVLRVLREAKSSWLSYNIAMAKEVKKPVKKSANNGGRVRKLTKKQAKAKAKKEVKTRQPLPSSFRLTWLVFKVIKKYWKTLGAIVLVYLLLNIIFASGLSNVSSEFDNIKADLQANGSSSTSILHAAGVFTALVGSAGSSGSSTGSSLQITLFIIESLVIIWALRHLISGQEIGVKQAYYHAMTPLIPFLLVLAVVVIQLLPATIGALVFEAVANSVITNGTVATVASSIIFVLLASWSFYMICASIFSLYIVTLPDMQPRQALRSAKDLIKHRRLQVIRRVVFLPLAILIFMGVVIVPLIFVASLLVPSVFFALSMLAILFVHTYLYSLYRSLIE